MVHSRAVSATSPVFDKLVNGGLKESQDRVAELLDVDPDTFVRFLEYAYRHDYTTRSCTQEAVAKVERSDSTQDGPVSGSDGIAKLLHTHPDNGWSNSKSAPADYGALAYTKVYPPQKTPQIEDPRAAFSKREYPHPTHDTDDHFHPVATTSPSHNYAPVFLTHARLYTFADMRMARPLKNLVLHKLHKSLVAFELHPERVGHVVELVRYAYEHGEDRSRDGRIDALRDMVVSFVVAEMKVLAGYDEVRELMEAGGEFAGDFWDLVSR